MLAKFIPGSISKVDELSDAKLFRFFSVVLLEFFDEGRFGELVVFVVGVVELVHAAGCSMGVVPDELLGSVELLGFGDLGLGWKGVGQDRLQPVLFYRRLAQLTHNKIMERCIDREFALTNCGLFSIGRYILSCLEALSCP